MAEKDAPSKKEVRNLKQSARLPFLFLLLLVGIQLLQMVSEISLPALMGIKPRTIEGLPGIVTFPLIHGGWDHLLSNSIPFLVLGTAIFYFYGPIALRSVGLIYIAHSVMVFIAARGVVHIGASGLVYGFAAFLLTSGVFRKERTLMALSMLVIFLYGGMLWGVLPIREGVSWEGHLFGALSGIMVAYYFRNEGPQKERYAWEEEDDLPETGVWDYHRHFPPPRHPGNDA